MILVIVYILIEKRSFTLNRAVGGNVEINKGTLP